jgi:hypothetical protein
MSVWDEACGTQPNPMQRARLPSMKGDYPTLDCSCGLHPLGPTVTLTTACREGARQEREDTSLLQLLPAEVCAFYHDTTNRGQSGCVKSPLEGSRATAAPGGCMARRLSWVGRPGVSPGHVLFPELR